MSNFYYNSGDLVKEWESLSFSNNFIFTKLMQNEEICRQTLELLLDIKISRLEYPTSEMSFKFTPESHGIRMDVYTADDNHYYDIEIQTTNKKNLLKRARYYSSIIDADVLKEGMDYLELRENIIIFLCLEDPFNKGLPLYTFKTKCVEDSTLPDDETTKLFYNIGNWKENPNPDVRNFLEFIITNNPKDEFTSKLSAHVTMTKKNADYRRQFMMYSMYLRDCIEDGIEQGIAEAVDAAVEKAVNEAVEKAVNETVDKAVNKAVKETKYESKIEAAVIAVTKFNIPPELAAKEYNIPLDELLKHL